jgi:opacity protein-like surface antigen
MEATMSSWSSYAIAFALGVLPAALTAQSDSTTRRDSIEARERLVKRMRQGAGLRVGSWQVRGLSSVSGSSSSLPAFEGYWQKGLDRHLVIETSAGLWSRAQRSSSTGAASSNSYVVPLLTSLKLYPATGPGAALEPFVTAGVGFTLGIDDGNAATGGIVGGGGGGGTMLIPGIGLKAGGGVEYHIGPAFGIVMQAGYQYVRFFQEVGSERTYKGLQMFGGVTYRFQF